MCLQKNNKSLIIDAQKFSNKKLSKCQRNRTFTENNPTDHRVS